MEESAADLGNQIPLHGGEARELRGCPECFETSSCTQESCPRCGAGHLLPIPVFMEWAQAHRSSLESQFSEEDHIITLERSWDYED